MNYDSLPVSWGLSYRRTNIIFGVRSKFSQKENVSYQKIVIIPSLELRILSTNRQKTGYGLTDNWAEIEWVRVDVGTMTVIQFKRNSIVVKPRTVYCDYSRYCQQNKQHADPPILRTEFVFVLRTSKTNIP